jgi:hypothetical protein
MDSCQDDSGSSQPTDPTKLKALKRNTPGDEAVDGRLGDNDIVELKMPKLREKNHRASINVGEISEMEAGVAESGREAGHRQQ